MSNVKSKFSLSFVMLLVVLMAMGSVFAATYVPVYMTITHENGTELKGGVPYTDIKPGDKIFVEAYCKNEDSIYWSQNLAFMEQFGYKKNDKGMAKISYYFNKNESAMVKTDDPTSAVIVIPDFEPGTRNILSIEGVAAVDNWEDHEAQTGWVNIYFEIPAEKPATTVKVSATKHSDTQVKLNATVTNSTFSKFVYFWNNDAEKTLTVNPAYVTVPTAVGTHTLTVKAVAADGTTDSTKYTVTVKAPEVPETKVLVQLVRVSDEAIKATATVSNSTLSKFSYNWNNGEEKTLTVNPANITVPTEIGTHTLTVTAVAADGTKHSAKYVLTNKAPEVPEEEELIYDVWMKEDNSMDELAVSLRNDSEGFDKGNKNFYALNEEIVYYVDYKNGGDDITKEVKLVLELPLNFKVIDPYGGKVDAKARTITWTFPKGLEENQAGTKVVKVAYTAFERSSKRYEIVYPVADIYERNKVVDSSAVINYIFKNEETEIKDEHYPYMYGDKNATTFRPDDAISRAEGALVLTRIFGIDTSGTTVESVFSDLGETYIEAQKAIVAATKLGLINGYPDGTYRPNAKMTRAEFMKIIASYIEVNAENEDIRGLEVKEDTNITIYKNPTSVYVTGSTTVNQHWASDYITMLVRLNMTPVSSKNRDLRLDKEITRAEVAQLVNLYLLRAPAEVSSSTKSGFSDVSKKHDLFEDIIEATRAAHTYTITKEGYEVEVEIED